MGFENCEDGSIRFDFKTFCCEQPMEEIEIDPMNMMNVTEGVAYICFKCGKLISFRVEMLDEDELEAYK